jgi:hypothetical protein
MAAHRRQHITKSGTLRASPSAQHSRSAAYHHDGSRQFSRFHLDRQALAPGIDKRPPRVGRTRQPPGRRPLHSYMSEFSELNYRSASRSSEPGAKGPGLAYISPPHGTPAVQGAPVFSFRVIPGQNAYFYADEISSRFRSPFQMCSRFAGQFRQRITSEPLQPLLQTETKLLAEARRDSLLHASRLRLNKRKNFARQAELSSWLPC